MIWHNMASRLGGWGLAFRLSLHAKAGYPQRDTSSYRLQPYPARCAIYKLI